MFDFFALCSDRTRLQDREELWQRLEQQATESYEKLAAQGDVAAPPPLMPFTPVDAVPPPLGNPSLLWTFFPVRARQTGVGFYHTLHISFPC